MSDWLIKQRQYSSMSGSLRGTISLPGDKSISHRALILGALGVGQTTISGLLESADVWCTIKALRDLGIEISKTSADVWILQGVGTGGMREPSGVLDLGNSGTAVRLLIGVVSSHPMTTFFTGDSSLTRRPMTRIIEPLERIGARFLSRAAGRLPLGVRGCDYPLPISYRLESPSAQVKSALMLCGLNVPGQTTVIDPFATRDHTERLFRHFDIPITVEKVEEKGNHSTTIISILGESEFIGQEVMIPGDISSAAFPIVAGLICPGSHLMVRGIGVNPRRTGLIETLSEMGATLHWQNHREICGEPVADLEVVASELQGVTVYPERAPTMIDEYPILAIAAACAEGVTTMTGLSELRVKESDRLTAIVEGLTTCGVHVTATHDSLTVYGTGANVCGDATICAARDHRIAMSFLILGMVAKKPITVDDVSTIDTSFPNFTAMMNRLGAHIESV